MAADSPIPGGATYCASKAALAMYSDAIRLEVAGRGIRCTTVHPSFVRTELIAGTRPSRAIRVVDPDDVAGAVARVLDRPKAHVYVPSSSSVALWAHGLLPRRAAEALGRRFGADRVFLSVDREQRQGYETSVRA